MAIEKTFIKEGIKESEVEEYLRERFKKAGYSHTEIERTPLGTRIIVYVNKPGLVIGRSGKRINDLTEEIKQKFHFENPLVDVKEIVEPFLDANIVAHRIANALQQGIKYKRVVGYYLEKIIGAGAIGVSIRVSGKLTGSERSSFKKFRKGFVAFSGDYAERLVDRGNARAMLKPGMVGVEVRIMRESPQEVDLKEKEKTEGEA